MRKILLKNFRIVDADTGFFGSLFIDNNIIKNIVNDTNNIYDADITIDGRAFGTSAVLLPAFIDLHAHFR